MRDINLLSEANRQFSICNACRYCEGYCAVFPAAERRMEFSAADVDYLAHLCHDCRGCFQACMYTEPHEFAVNIPQLLSAARVESFRRHAWPGAFAEAFRRPGTAFAAVAVVAIAAMVGWLGAQGHFGVLSVAQSGTGTFYRVVPYAGMVGVALALTAWAIVAWGRGTASYLADLRASGALEGSGSVMAALWDGVALTYLKGGGGGCFYPDHDAPSITRRWLHITLVLGMFSAFIATSVAAVFQDMLGWEPPYPWFSAPVIFGVIGGLGIVVGSSGLLTLKRSTTKELAPKESRALDVAFLWALDGVAVTGMLLLLLRTTSAMGLMLVVHLGLVAAFFATAPYGKFVHALYRLAALAAYHREEAKEERS